ncbi:BrnT family toxin [Crocosphaera sp. XPORK-15E]|uniref:BrnT family toxin n=1 Tax=Crocosphaera sp. XPORK-15E TaxID=3110247 RepID=UPI002B1ED98F|nr:BrnT family toxin [Crocosphaera sp. XPORK-15E]MEA5533154.1 BrnT family toxin [Crocosphaera sp. XPORK-15E]
MRYTWDEAKNEANLRKHGLSFFDADLVYESSVKLTLPSQYDSFETRWIDIAQVQEEVLLLVYTIREDTIRCISFRKASRKERRLYYDKLQQ